jgi:hypothetical protein
MSWISLISSLVKLCGLIAEWLERTRLINQGRKEQMNASLMAWKNKVDIASRARHSVKSTLNSLRNDLDRRD